MNFTVTNTSDSGLGSLRWAIEQANGAAAPSTISFAVNGTITLQSNLPSLTSSVQINGSSAPDFHGQPNVGLNSNGFAGLVFAPGSNGSSLTGFAVTNAGGNGVTIESSNVTIAGDYIGLTTTGSSQGNHGDGIYVAATLTGNVIGSNPDAASSVISNVIAANDGDGIRLDGSSGNVLVDNYTAQIPPGQLLWAMAGTAYN